MKEVSSKCDENDIFIFFYSDGIDRYLQLEEDEEDKEVKRGDMSTQDKPLVITWEQTGGQDEYGFLSDKPSNPHHVVFMMER